MIMPTGTRCLDFKFIMLRPGFALPQSHVMREAVSGRCILDIRAICGRVERDRAPSCTLVHHQDRISRNKL